MESLIGCCGWSEAREKYFSHFRAVEVQTTFYEPPSLALAEKWRQAAPVSFEFCIKAWQLITHGSSSPTYRRLRSKLSPQELEEVGFFRPTEQVHLAWERTREIARALRARTILFQCPASFQPTGENIRNLEAFFGEANRQEFGFAWEPRGGWPDDLVKSICAGYNLVHCVDPFKATAVTTENVYWRLHGITGYGYRYSDQELSALNRKLEDAAAAGAGEAFVFFNNIRMKEDALRFQTVQAGTGTGSAAASPIC